MTDLLTWMMKVPEHRLVPLFLTNDDLLVETRVNSNGRRLLKRSSEMEDAIITIVENGLRNKEWQGLFYVMGQGTGDRFRILYIGKADRKGVKHPISENIKNIRKNKHKFARWGDGLAYHIGDLSQVLFKFRAYKKPANKYKRWAEALFQSFDPPILKENTYLYIAPWYSHSVGPSGMPCSLPAVEKELISLASLQFQSTLLNVDGI